MRRNFTRILLLSIALWVNSVTSFAQISLPFTMTESLFNSSDVDKNINSNSYRHVWDDGQIRMYATGLLSQGCGVCSNDHYFTVHIEGVPDRISFSTSASDAATATVGWTLQESEDGSTWTQVWKKNARDNEVDVELSKATRYIRLHENFNYSGYVKDFTVTACHYVKLVVDEDTVYVSNPLRQGESYDLTAPDVLSSGCRSFAGWSQSLSGTMGDHDVVIYAQYEIPTYIATLHLSDSVQSIDLKDEALQAKCGQSIQVKNPTVKGFTFEGWNPTLPSIASSEMEGKTYVAQWSRNVHTFSTVVDGDTQRVALAYDQPLPVVADPVKPGYLFLNWEPALPATMPDEDFSVVAQFKKGLYLLSLVVDGDTLSSDSLLIGSAIDRESLRPADKEGFDYQWLSEDVTLMPDSDVVLVGQFARKSFSLKVYDADSVYVDSVMPYESAISLVQPEKRGYELENWSDIPSNMPAEAVNVLLSWSKLSYPLTMMVDTDTFYTAIYGYGDTILYPAMPDSANYALVWNTDLPTVMSDDSLLLFGSWKIQYVTFTAVSEGDTLRYAVYKPGDLIDPLLPADREGYTFDGWNPEVPVAMPAYDFTTYAGWLKNSYPFYLMVAGDTLYQTEIAYNDSIILPQIDGEKGYSLVLDQPLPVYMPADTLVATASWVQGLFPFVLMDDSVVVKDTMVTMGTALSDVVLTKEGYTFAGWSPAIPAAMPDSAFKAAAMWRINQYPFVILVDGDTLVSEQIDYQAAISYTYDRREGYTLKLAEEVPAAMPAQALLIDATWTANHHRLVLNDGAKLLSDTVVAYGTLLAVEDLNREGYSFEGWNPTLPATMPDSDFVATAVWRENSYALAFFVDGDTLSQQYYPFGAEVTAPVVVDREGYSFQWIDSIPSLMPAKEVAVRGFYRANDYRFIVLVDGDTVQNKTYAYDSKVDVIDAPVKSGYTFQGWSDTWPERMPAKDLTLSAVWNTSLFSYKVMDGETALVDTLYAFGAPVAPLSKLTKEGHSFVGWDTTYAIMPAHDVAINAQWNRLEYTITLMMVSAVNNAMLGKPQKITLPYGAEIESEIEKPQFDGYEYDGWKNDCPTTMPAKGFALIALMKPLQTVGCEDLQNGPLTVRVLDRTIYLENYDGGENVRLYDLLGNLLYEGRERSFSVKKTGLYVVQTPERSVKVVVK